MRDINNVYNVKVEEEEENVGAATAAAAAAAAVLSKNNLNSCLDLEFLVKDWENGNL